MLGLPKPAVRLPLDGSECSMKRVQSAVEAGRCVLALSGDLLRNADVMLALSERRALPSVALSGPAVAPVQAITDDALVRAVASPGGVVVVVEPGPSDQSGLQALAKRLADSSNMPTVLVVGRTFNPLLYGSVFRGIPVAHLKGRGRKFVTQLPKPPSEEEAPKPVVEQKKKAKREEIVPSVYVGREEEQAALVELLGAGGPIVVSGPSGVGKRQLVEHAIAESGLTRLPDLALGWGSVADTLAARLAEVARAGGSDKLAKALTSKHKPGEVFAAAVEALAEASGCEGQVMVISALQHAIGREGDFFRKGRLEMLVRELLTHTYPLRLVFLSERQPVFHRAELNQAVRRLELEGIKGRFYFDIFSAMGAPEFPRDRFGPMSEKVHGNPLAVRTYAAEVHDKGVELTEDPKFLVMKDPSDASNLRKVLQGRIKKLQKAAKAAFLKVAHLRYAVDGATLASLGLGRRGRTELVRAGLLDIVGPAGRRRYGVHPLVRRCVPVRDRSDFDIMGQLAEMYRRKASDADGVEKLAFLQEANRLALGARKLRNRVKLEFPDNDQVVESILGLMRSQRPRPDLARRRVDEVLREDPSNAETQLLHAELIAMEEGSREDIEAALTGAYDVAAVPELFHQAANYYLRRKARKGAIGAMEKALEVFPTESRLHTRLGALLLREGRRKDAIDHLRRAMEIDPQLPDAYGLLGMARRDEGIDALQDVDGLLREAVRLAPEDPVQVSRLVDYLLARARVEADKREELWREAREHLDVVLTGDRRAPESHLLLATLLREQGGDVARARWLLRQARKVSERNPGRMARIRLEHARLDVVEGHVDKAESTLRELANKEPSNHAVFAALSEALEAREQLIPAHAEMMRAKERTAATSLERIQYESELTRLQDAIERGVAALMGRPPVPAGDVATTVEIPVDEAAPATFEEPGSDPDPAEPGVVEATYEVPAQAGEDQGSESPVVEEAAAAEPAADQEVAAEAEAPAAEPASEEPVAEAEPVEAEAVEAEPVEVEAVETEAVEAEPVEAEAGDDAAEDETSSAPE